MTEGSAAAPVLTALQRRLLWISLWVVVLLMMAYGWAQIDPNYANLNDNGVRLTQALNWLDNGGRSFAIANEDDRIDPERRFDPHFNTLFFYESQGEVYGIYSNLNSVIVGLAIALLGPYGPFIMYMLMLLLCAGITYLLARQWIAGLAPLAPILLIATTPALFYALDYWELVPTLLFATLGVYAWFTAQDAPKRQYLWLVISGLCVGVALWLRTEAYFLLPAIFLGFVWQIQRLGLRSLVLMILAWGIGVGLLVLPMWWFQWQQSGHFLGAHIVANIEDSSRVTNQLQTISYLLPPSSGRWLIVVVVILGSRLLAPFVQLKRPERIYLLLSAAVIILVGFNFVLEWFMSDYRQPASLLRGFPLVLFLAFWPWRGLREPGTRAVPPWLISAVLLIMGYVLSCMAISSSLGGPWEWGPRLLLPIFPLLVLLIAFVVQQVVHLAPLARWSSMVALLFLMVVSMATQVFGAQWSGERNAFRREFGSQLLTHDERIIVTEIHWLVHIMPQLVREKTVFWVSHDDPNLPELLDRFEAESVESFLFLTVVVPDLALNMAGPSDNWDLVSQEHFTDGFHTLFDLSVYQHLPDS